MKSARILIAGLMIGCLVAYAQTRQTFSVGASANDGTGDSLRGAFIKVSNNESNLFLSLYTNGPASRVVESVSDLIAFTGFDGAHVQTLGYYTAGDGGGATYRWADALPSGVSLGTTWIAGLTGYWQNITPRDPSSGAVLPFAVLSGITNYWALGDSQTIGQFALEHDFTDPSKVMYDQFKYANIIADKYGLNLTNRGVSGSRIAYTATAPGSVLAQANVIPAEWAGVVTVMSGYNDSTSDNYGDTTRAHAMFRAAGTAIIARLLASDWINPQGLNSSGASVGTFATTGVVSDGGNAGKSPFPVGSPATDTRKLLTMTAGDTVTFSATNPVVWMQTSPTGGVAQLWQGTNQIAGIDTDTADTATYFLPQAMTGMGLTGEFTVTNVSGTTVLMAVGSVKAAPEANRTIIIASPVRLGSSTRFDGVGAMIANALKSAAHDWAFYHVGYADTASKIDLNTMIPTGDPDHPGPRGHKAMAAAFEIAARPDALSSAGSPAPRYTDQGFQIYGGLTSVSQYTPKKSILASVSGGIAYIDSYLPPSGPYYPLTFRAKTTRFQQGSVIVAGSLASTADWPIDDFLELSTTSTPESIVSAVTYNGSSYTYNPILLRGKTTSVSSGPFQVQSTASAISDYKTGDSLTLSTSSGTSYVDSASSDGASLTYLPMELRAKTTAVTTGALQIQSSASATADYRTGNSLTLATTGGVSYVDAFSSDGASLTYIPLNMRSKRVHISTGHFSVGGGPTAVSDYQLGNQLTASMSSGVGYIQSLTSDGTSTTYLPLRFRGSSVNVESSLQAETIELGNSSDTTLARSAAGSVTIEGDHIVTAPSTATLTTSGGNVTVTGGRGKVKTLVWAADGNANLVFSGLVDGDTGTLLVAAASTNVTLTLTDAFAYSPSGTSLTVTGGTNLFSVVAWKNTVVSGTNVVLVNLGDYSR